MPRTDLQGLPNNDVEKLFLQDIHPIIPKVVGQACADLRDYPCQIEPDDFVQQINVLLMEDDYHDLRSFDHRSKPQTWLYTIAWRHILHWLQEQSRVERLDDMPPDSSIFVVQQDQEKKLLAKEREAILQAAVSKLTEHDKKLLGLWLQEWSVEEIAEEMRIKERSVSREISALMKKLQKIVREGYAI